CASYDGRLGLKDGACFRSRSSWRTQRLLRPLVHDLRPVAPLAHRDAWRKRWASIVRVSVSPIRRYPSTSGCRPSGEPRRRCRASGAATAACVSANGMSRTLANDSIHVFRVKIAAVARGVARSYGRTVAATGAIPASRASAYILASSRSTDSASDPPKMSFTPARMITYAGFAERTSRASRPRISVAVCPSIPRFKTVQSGWAFIIQCAYWLSGLPWPFGGASSGERNEGVPAVVESPRPTITKRRTGIEFIPEPPPPVNRSPSKRLDLL